jgi:hypothetical protein
MKPIGLFVVLPNDLVWEQTHPLPQGGTDLIAFEPSIF